MMRDDKASFYAAELVTYLEGGAIYVAVALEFEGDNIVMYS